MTQFERACRDLPEEMRAEVYVRDREFTEFLFKVTQEFYEKHDISETDTLRRELFDLCELCYCLGVFGRVSDPLANTLTGGSVN